MNNEGAGPERAARYSDLFAEKHEHTSDCVYCPICSAISVVRNTKPELLDHLAAAARELILAAGILLEEAGEVIGKPDERPPGKGSRSRAEIRRIDIS